MKIRKRLLATCLAMALAVPMASLSPVKADTVSGDVWKVKAVKEVDESGREREYSATYYSNGKYETLSFVGQSYGSTEESTYFYDVNGSPLEYQLKYTHSDGTGSEQKTTFGSDGRILESKGINPDGSLFFHDVNEFDEAGELIKTVGLTQDEIVYDMTEDEYYTRYYYKNGTPTGGSCIGPKSNYWYSEDRISTYVERLRIIDKLVEKGKTDPGATYDKQGRLTKVSWYDAEYNYTITYTGLVYDANGHLTNYAYEIVPTGSDRIYAYTGQITWLLFKKGTPPPTAPVEEEEKKPENTGKPITTPVTPDLPEVIVITPAVGTSIATPKDKYVVTKRPVGKTKPGEVAYVAPKTKRKTVKVPASITVDSYIYNVTSIKANSFMKDQKLRSITIGKNVKKIAAKAFYNCKSLKTVIIKTTKLTKNNVGKAAFAKINPRATVKVPKKKLKAYKTILKARGINGKKQTIKAK